MRVMQKGFTLIEMVVVIATLGILAAIAIPRFIDVQSEARIAVINGLDGALHSATVLARAQYKIEGSLGTSITMDGQVVDVISGTGRPAGTAPGITTAMLKLSGFGTPTYAAGVATFQLTNGGSATCQITYTDSTGDTAATTGGC